MKSVKNRVDLQGWFEAAGGGRGFKTLVLEVHKEDPVAGDATVLAGLFPDQQVLPTEDGALWRLVGDEEFVVDSLNRRFWRFHTHDASGSARRILDRAVSSSRHLDKMWLPWEHMVNIQSNVNSPPRASFKAGQIASDKRARVSFNKMGKEEHAILRTFHKNNYSVVYDSVVLSIYDSDYGHFQEKLRGDGTFIVTGETFSGHECFVGDVVKRYRRLIEGVESNALRWVASGAGVKPLGKPIVIQFDGPFPDRVQLYKEMFSCRLPFRLWAPALSEKSATLEEAVISVQAVDLHVGQRLKIEMGDDWIRVSVREGVCGNTVARLIANLQQYVSSPLRLADPELQAALDQTLSYPDIPEDVLALA